MRRADDPAQGTQHRRGYALGGRRDLLFDLLPLPVRSLKASKTAEPPCSVGAARGFIAVRGAWLGLRGLQRVKVHPGGRGDAFRPAPAHLMLFARVLQRGSHCPS